MTMVDRVAGILYMKSGMNTSIVWKDVSDDWRPEFIEEAKAIIAAMREPMPSMVAAGWRARRECSDKDSDIMEPIWQAMIDAALEE